MGGFPTFSGDFCPGVRLVEIGSPSTPAVKGPYAEICPKKVICFFFKASKIHVNAMVDQVVLLGMGNLPPLIRNPYNGYINPYY